MWAPCRLSGLLSARPFQQELTSRYLEVVDRLQHKHKHEDETVVLVTHMGPARLLISYLGRIPLKDTYQMEFPLTVCPSFASTVKRPPPSP